MPKRVIDFDAMWASDKIAVCAEWAQAEYAWLYGLADCCGCFELTNLRVIWGRVAAVRKNLSLERLEQVFDEFHDKGLLFRWNENGKRYGHWTGSDVPGRLPPPSWRNRLERLAPPVPAEQFAEYLAASFLGSAGLQSSRGGLPVVHARSGGQESRLELAQAQGLDLEWEGKGDVETLTPVLEIEKRMSERSPIPIHEKPLLGKGESKSEPQDAEPKNKTQQLPTHSDALAGATPETLARIWEEERGSLPELRELTVERSARCRGRIANARKKLRGNTEQFLADFREAVRRAAATPFLTGAGPAGWRANFDWIVANDTNYLKVLEGRYDSGVGASVSASPNLSARDEAARREIYAGAGPQLSSGDSPRVRAGVIERAMNRR